jgi:hypothetical protein
MMTSRDVEVKEESVEQSNEDRGQTNSLFRSEPRALAIELGRLVGTHLAESLCKDGGEQVFPTAQRCGQSAIRRRS